MVKNIVCSRENLQCLSRALERFQFDRQLCKCSLQTLKIVKTLNVLVRTDNVRLFIVDANDGS